MRKAPRARIKLFMVPENNVRKETIILQKNSQYAGQLVYVHIDDKS